MNQAEAITFLHDVHDTLAHEQDLSPNNPKVNSCLSRLVSTLQSWQRADFGEDLADHPELSPLAQILPVICGKAECEMEKWWCRRILASDCPGAQALAAFWYLDEYKALCETELQLLGRDVPGRFAFLGSGALPVTAILLAMRRPDVHVTCVDCDEEACGLAKRLVTLLGLADRVRIEMSDAQDYNAAPDETIICASLLDAPSLFDKLRKQETQRLIIRDSEGLSRFCYRPARLPQRGYVERAKSMPSPERINTSRYFALCYTAQTVDRSPEAAYLIS